MSYNREILDRNTTIAKARVIAQNTYDNLPQALATPYALSGDRPCDGLHAAVVGSGPSLARQIEQLRDFSGVVFAASSAVGFLAKNGILVDVAVVIESVDVSSHLASAGKPYIYLVADVSAHTKIWDLKPNYWVADGGVASMGLHLQLGTRPLHNGGSTSTATARLAFEWGASMIWLFGHDLGWQEAHEYSPGAGWASQEERDAAHDRSGVPRIPLKRETIEVPRTGGGKCLTYVDYYSQIEWYEQFAQRIPIVNVTRDGANLEGTLEPIELEGHEAPARLPGFFEPEGTEVSDRVYEPGFDVIEVISQLPDTGLVGIPGLVQGSPITETAAAGAILATEIRGDDKMLYVYKCLQDAAHDLQLVDPE